MKETTIKERPILFSTPMVKAILDGNKTVTRRIIKVQPDADSYFEMKLQDGVLEIDYNQGDKNPKIECPYGKPGDILWVRENFQVLDYWQDSKSIQVMYDGGATQICQLTDDEWRKFSRWQDPTERKPSIFLLKSAARLRLE